jgi:acetyl-CoA carboxylase biotin carboxyl carrier protein
VNLTHEDVQEILRLLDASPFDELQLETDRFKLTLRRAGASGWTQETNTLATARVMKEEPPAAPTSEDAIARNTGYPAAPTNQGATAPSSATAPAAAPAAATAADAPRVAPATAPLAATPTTINILTPIIGTFYRAPKPGTAPFVEVGSEVTPNTVVGIIETMKLMNSVYAGAHGKVVEICQGDGKFVEQDQVLMRLNPA